MAEKLLVNDVIDSGAGAAVVALVELLDVVVAVEELLDELPHAATRPVINAIAAIDATERVLLSGKETPPRVGPPETGRLDCHR
jgi:hypothetical protein